MHILVTGANGFVGQALVLRLLAQGLHKPDDVTQLTLIDQAFTTELLKALDDRARIFKGDLADMALLDTALTTRVDVAFHLASVPGALAESQPDQGYRVNLLGMLSLFERLGAAPHLAPRVVFASTVAVYGTNWPPVVDINTPLRPSISYGAHKQVGEVILSDMSRQGRVDGCSLRLPGIVARPPVNSGHGSAFMSEVMHAATRGRAYVCPVSRDAMAWWMSLSCCVDNLVHAALLPAHALAAQRIWQPPVLRASVGELINALARRYGSTHIEGITHEPVPRIEDLFGRLPPLLTSESEAAGFQNDGNLDALVERALGASAASSSVIPLPTQAVQT